MSDKKQIITMLREEFNRWEDLLFSLSEEQITAPHLPSNLSIKDVTGHLRAWQQISVARLEAALLDKEPEFRGWPEGLDPDAHNNLEQINAWIHETYREQPWSSVYRDWREGFLRFLELGEAIPETELFDTGRYRWLEGDALSAVLTGSYEHHEEHLESLVDWLRKHGKMTIGG